MFKIPFLGIQAGCIVTLVICLTVMAYGTLRNRSKGYFILGTLAQIVVFPLVSIAAMFAIAPFFEYGGTVPDLQSWHEEWIKLPDKIVKMKFWKSTACEELTGTTDRDAWDAWRETYQINEPSVMPPPQTDLFKAIDVNSGGWIGYSSKVAANGASRKTWFREKDGIMLYRRNYW